MRRDKEGSHAMSSLFVRRAMVGYCAFQSAAYVSPLYFLLEWPLAGCVGLGAALFLFSAAGVACAMVGAQGPLCCDVAASIPGVV